MPRKKRPPVDLPYIEPPTIPPPNDEGCSVDPEFEELWKAEAEAIEEQKPQTFTEPKDIGGVLLLRLRGIVDFVEPLVVALPERITEAVADTNYKVKVRISSHDRRQLDLQVNAAIRAGKGDIPLGSVCLWLHAVQGWDAVLRVGTHTHSRRADIGPNEHSSPPYAVDLTYIYRLKKSPKKEEV